MYRNLLNTLYDKHISRNQLAKMSDITPSDLYSALNGNKPMYPNWRKRIADALEMPEDELFEEGR